MERISVIGSSGSGKSTMARTLADLLDLPYLELDSVFHQPGWERKPDDEFRAEVSAFVAGDRWVVDGNYTSHGVAQLVWPRADTIVWLDPPRRVVMGRIVRRTLRRVATRQHLWNGNRETWSNLFRRDPDKNIILWAWTRFRPVRERYETVLEDGSWDHLTVVRLRRRREVRAFRELLVTLRGQAPSGSKSP
jgi:adenylate kinase family enzyme